MTAAGSLKRLADASPSSDAVFAINAGLEQAGSPLFLTEKTVEGLWSRALRIEGNRPGRWLLLVRVAEAALLCTGNYADSCEFSAAGDFLVNPREIVIRSRSGGRSTVKKRHGRISEQFGFAGNGSSMAMKLFSDGVYLETAKAPLLPLMTQVLKESGRVASSFINRLEVCQRRIADTLGFLAAWRITDAAEFWKRMKASSPTERAFAESCMCRFETGTFYRIGAELWRSLARPDHRSSFLSWPLESIEGLDSNSPAAVPRLVEVPV